MSEVRYRASAGLLPFTRAAGEPLFFIGHMGGPFWQGKEQHAWSIIKGEFSPDDETPFEAASREWVEETGTPVPPGEWIPLGLVTQRNRKVVHAFAVEAGDPLAVRLVSSSSVRLMWPPRSGRWITFPEIDRAEWCDAASARTRLTVAQGEFVDRLLAHLTEPAG